MVNLDPKAIHEMIVQAFTSQKNAYVPSSGNQVGAAVLTEDGSIVGGCNVENLSPGATICAERNAIPTAVAMGHRNFVACAVTGLRPVPGPITPCGLCRQTMREHFALSVPVFMITGQYPYTSPEPPETLLACLDDLAREASLKERAQAGYAPYISAMTLEELYPVSYGRRIDPPPVPV